MIYTGLLLGVVILVLVARLSWVEFKLYVARVEAAKADGLFKQLSPKIEVALLGCASPDLGVQLHRLRGTITHIKDVL